MKRLRKCLAVFALSGAAAIGCNGLLGIDDGAYAPNTDSGSSTNPSETGTGGEDGPLADGPTTDAPFDSNLPKNDAGNELLAADQDRVLSLVQDADNLYWISGGAIKTVPKSGASAPRTITTVANASLIAVDPGSASSGSVFVVALNKISSHPKVGGTGTAGPVTSLDPDRTAIALGSDGSSLLMIDFKEESPEEYAARRVPRAGGTVSAPLANATDVQLLGVSATWAAFLDLSPRRVFEVAPPGNGAPSSPFTNIGGGFPKLPNVRNMFLDSSKMYWLDYVSGASATILRSRARGATTPPEDIATIADPVTPLFVVVDGTSAYVLTTRDVGGNVKGDVIRVAKGSPDVTVIKDLDTPTGLVAAGGYVFVAEDVVGKGTIQKIKPK